MDLQQQQEFQQSLQQRPQQQQPKLPLTPPPLPPTTRTTPTQPPPLSPSLPPPPVPLLLSPTPPPLPPPLPQQQSQFHHNRHKHRNRKSKAKTIKILYANMRGIRSKVVCLTNTLCEVNADVGLFCETFLTENKGIKMDGYTFFGRARTEGKGGGVGISVRNDRKALFSPHYTERPLELIWVSVALPNEKPLYVGVYYGLQESVNLGKMQEARQKGRKSWELKEEDLSPESTTSIP